MIYTGTKKHLLSVTDIVIFQLHPMGSVEKYIFTPASQENLDWHKNTQKIMCAGRNGEFRTILGERTKNPNNPRILDNLMEPQE